MSTTRHRDAIAEGLAEMAEEAWYGPVEDLDYEDDAWPVETALAVSATACAILLGTMVPALTASA